MNVTTLEDRANNFRLLHQQPGIFVTPNPWDAGSARILETLGFKALATTSAGLAYTLGKQDGHAVVTRDEALQNARSIVAATNLPVSADLENGYGDEPSTCAETILLAFEAGLAGGSIEDATGRAAHPIYPFELAVERVKAAVVARNNLPHSFMLTARAENLIQGRPDLKDTIRRLVAFAEAGADVLFAPGLRTREEIETAVRAVAPRPLHVIMGLAGVNFSLEMLQEMGVKRVSIGSSLARAAYGSLISGAQEIMQKGTFAYANPAVPYADFNKLFGKYNN